MSLPARRHRQHCAGRGPCAPGLRARSLRVTGARSAGARGRRSVGDHICGRRYHPSSRTWGERTGSSASPPAPPPFRTPRGHSIWGSI